MSKSAVLYIRVSYSEQVQGFSLESQERECRSWCDRHGYTVAKVFREEGVSAKSRNKRVAFEAAISYIKSSRKPVNAFVVVNTDRFARNALDHLMVKDILSGKQCRLVSVTENFDDSIWGRFFEVVKAGLNQAENEERAQKVKYGMAEACRQGYWPWQPPLGYVRHWTDGDKPNLKLDPVMAPILRRAFQEYASGTFTQVDVVARANDRGLRTSNYKKLNKQHWRRMLSNPIYVGKVKTTMLDEESQGRWEPLMDQDTWDIIQGLVSGAQLGVKHTTVRAEFPLRGFILCGFCGKPMSASWSTGKGGNKYSYYHCPPCRKQSLRAEKMEEAFADFLIKNIRIDADYAAAMREIIMRQYKEESKFIKSEAKAKEKARKEAERKRDRLEGLLIDGKIEPGTYDRQMTQLKADLGQAIMEDTEAQTTLALNHDSLDNTLKFLLQPGEEWRKASTTMKMSIQRLLFSNGVPWTKGEGFGTTETNSAVNDLRSLDGTNDNLVGYKLPTWKNIFRFVDKIGEIYAREAA